MTHNNPSAPLAAPLSRSLARTATREFRKLRYRRSTNAPFLSGDSFAEACDYRVFGWTGQDRFEPRRALSAESVFVQADRLEEYLSKAQELGTIPKVLVTGNSDRDFSKNLPLPSGVNLWLCQNNSVLSESVKTLPIGLENIRLGRSGLPKWFPYSSNSNQKKVKVFVPPMSDTNPIRRPSVEYALKKPTVFDVLTDYLPSDKYFSIVREYKFVLCLEGNGFENHRTWETLYLDSFPILLESPFSRTLLDLDVPILVVPSLDSVTLELLNSFLVRHRDFSARATPQLWIPHWTNLIRETSYQ